MLRGGDGGDILTGGVGGDLIAGGNGRDRLNGNGGNDAFDFNTAAESGVTAATRDVIDGFVHAADEIDLATIDAKAGTEGNQVFSFIGAARFSAEGQIRAVRAGDDTLIQLNIAGASGAEASILLSNFAAGSLTAGDFVL